MIRYRAVFGNGEFRALWLAQVLSLVGDRLAKVALTVLVFGRTGSPLLTAVTYALVNLPWLIGGPLLSGIADRTSRRAVMVGCDVARTVLIGAMAVPGMPLPAMLALVFVAGLFGPPFGAARSALMPEVFDDRDAYVAASAVGNATFESTQVAGFAVGGAMVAAFGSHLALGLDAASFAASGLLVGCLVRRRPAPQTGTEPHGGWWSDLRAGYRLVFHDRWLRALAVLAWLAAFFVAPDVLAVPYAASRQMGATTAGLLLAANPVGATLGALVLARLVPGPVRQRWIAPMAVLCGVPLIACALQPGPYVTWSLWFGSGLFAAYNLPAGAAFVLSTPDSRRGQAYGLVATGLQVGQGLGLLGAGGLATALGALPTVAVFGALGSSIALIVAVTLRTTRR